MTISTGKFTMTFKSGKIVELTYDEYWELCSLFMYQKPMSPENIPTIPWPSPRKPYYEVTCQPSINICGDSSALVEKTISTFKAGEVHPV